MTVYVASDHTGFELKELLLAYIVELGHSATDVGAYEQTTDDDYPDFIAPCASRVANTEGAFGIVIGGSGHGETMVANRLLGARAATFYAPHPQKGYDIVRLAREHNNANILSIGARFVSEEEAKEAVRLFLETPFSEDERHVRRLGKF